MLSSDNELAVVLREEFDTTENDLRGGPHRLKRFAFYLLPWQKRSRAFRIPRLDVAGRRRG